jgi:hypothetical protein
MENNCLDREKYINLCNLEKIPLFAQYWWMDAVCGKEKWDVILVEKGGQIVASLPFYLKQMFGFKISMQPTLTQHNGIWIKYPKGQKYSQKLKYEKEIYNRMTDLC